MDREFNLFAAVALTLSVILIVSSCAVASEDTSISVEKHLISVVPEDSGKTFRITELLKVRNRGHEEFEGVLRLPIPSVSNDVHGDVLRDNVTCLAVNRENDRVVVKPFTSSGVKHSQERADVPLSYRGQRENMTLVVRVDNSSKKVHPEIVSGKMAKPDWKTKRVNGVRFKYSEPIRAKFQTKSVAGTPTYLYARENAFLVNLDNDKKQVRVRIENSHSEGWGLRIGGLENKTLNYELDGHENRRVKLLGWSPNFEAVLRLTYSIKQAPDGSTPFGKEVNYPTSQLQFWILKIENRPIVKTDLKHFERQRKSENAVWQVYQVENPTPDSKYNFILVSKSADKSVVSGWLLVVIAGVVFLSVYGVYRVIGTNRANNFDDKNSETEESEAPSNVEMMAEALADLRKDYENGNISEDVFKELEEKYKETGKELAGERE
ncbi:hypothetical protein AKJ57_05890 [candidate division MSBL1 archaeon SCGC-AAA259A05]|uniref:Uncharacterized protein n=1 Tax=candidate division MSBL1 archaeon SCGC-AAA259A05 TaxID=1698259 RepID=A0A133U4E2_9EURY|nr:hypothetical protein AKJ57_05890 [candidate division MSBL1 archaeon SCGC-AAA259A05]